MKIIIKIQQFQMVDNTSTFTKFKAIFDKMVENIEDFEKKNVLPSCKISLKFYIKNENCKWY